MLRMFAVLLCFAAGTYLGLRSVVYASCFFIWNDIFRPVSWARFIGVLRPGLFYPVHICTAVLALSLIFGKWERRWHRGVFAFLIFLGWVFTSAIFAVNVDIAMDKALDTAKYIIPLTFITASLTNRWSQQLFLMTLAASVGIWMAHHGLDCLLKGGQPEIHMHIPGGQMHDRNDFMVAGTACIPLMGYLGWYYEGRFLQIVRWGSRVMLGLGVVALFLSLSRGAVVGFSCLLLWYIIATGRTGKRVLIGAVVAVLIVLSLPDAVWDRLSTIEANEQPTDRSALQRIEMMRAAVKVTLEHPFTGVGPANFPYVATAYAQYDAEPHSIWLKCSAEYGVPMLVFFVLLIASFLVELRKLAHEARGTGDRQSEGFAVMLSCAIVGFLATGTFTSQFLSEYLWAILALTGAVLATPRARPVEPSPGSAEANVANPPPLSAVPSHGNMFSR